MTQETVTAPIAFHVADSSRVAPVALLSAAAALPHLLTTAEAGAPAAGTATVASPVRLPRPRRLWGREDGFTMAGARR